MVPIVALLIWIKNVGISEKTDKKDYQELVHSLDLETPVIIKPNWGTSLCYTEAQIIDWTLESIQGEVLLVESYGWSRTREMLETGKLGSKKKGDLRRSDQWFLEYSGIGKILKKHGVEFLNITEENWGKRTMDPENIQFHVEGTHQPVEDPDFYSWMPEKLYELKGADFLSLAKLRLGIQDIPASLSIKNLFGMIPHPSRWRYHGKKNCILDQSIVDIYKVYDSLFNIKGITEAVFTHTDMDIEHNKMIIRKNMGFASASKSPLSLDSVVMALCGLEPYRAHIRAAADMLGGWDPELVENVKDDKKYARLVS
jgi:uncharacterized protein (DUF362 family)